MNFGVTRGPRMESSSLLASSAVRPRAGKFIPVVGLLGVAMVALLAVSALSERSSTVLLETDGSLDLDKPQLADNGEECWICPCCAGCEATNVAMAAGCDKPKAKAVHTEAKKQKERASKNQAKLQSKVEASKVKATETQAVKSRVTEPVAGTKPVVAARSAAAVPKGSAAPKPSVEAKSAAPVVLPQPAVNKAAAPKGRRLQIKRRQIKIERVAEDEPRPLSDNDNRLKDSSDVFEDASYLSPKKYNIPHLTKKIGGHLHEDVIAPWITGADGFKQRTTFNDDGTVKEFHSYQDPAGLFAQNPTDEEPFVFTEGKHWDTYSPEDKGFTHGEDWSGAGAAKLATGDFTNGDHKKFEDLDDAQWGFQHQFADWDPDGDKSERLVCKTSPHCSTHK